MNVFVKNESSSIAQMALTLIWAGLSFAASVHHGAGGEWALPAAGQAGRLCVGGDPGHGAHS